MNTVTLALAAALLSISRGGPLSPAPEAPTPRDPAVIMHDLAAEFRALEAALDSRDLTAAAGHAATLRERAEPLVDLRASADTPHAEFFPRYAQALRTSGEKLAEHARAANLADSYDELERTRATCVACHIRFRERNDERGSIPGRAGTITGQTSVTTVTGKPRQDRSNVLLFVEAAPYVRPSEVPHPHRAVSQRDRRFEPRVLPILKGSSVEFDNDDFVYHNVFSLSETQPFDLGAYGPKDSKSVLFPRTGVARVYCNIHPDMVASIVVLDNPCFALTDETGFFVITGVPEGSFVLRAWHELGGDWQEQLTVQDGRVLRIAPVIREAKAVVEHKNKFGKPYRGEYR